MLSCCPCEIMWVRPGEHPSPPGYISSSLLACTHYQNIQRGVPAQIVPLLQWLVLISAWLSPPGPKSIMKRELALCSVQLLMQHVRGNDRQHGFSQDPIHRIFHQKRCLYMVIKREWHREKDGQREKSSLCVRYNKKDSSYWEGLKPPVVQSVHFSTRGGTHCPLCAS